MPGRRIEVLRFVRLLTPRLVTSLPKEAIILPSAIQDSRSQSFSSSHFTLVIPLLGRVLSKLAVG
jgi:hypothetical protein